MKFERTAILVIVVTAVLFLGYSASALFYFPVADSYQWYGDETWLMLAWKHLIAHGTMTVPIALGSSLSKTSGLLTGSTWLSGILYGVPQLLSPPTIDIVNIGRTVTLALALGIICLLVFAAHRWKLRTLPTSIGVLLLLTTNSFTINSHSARYDIATGLSVLGFVVYFATQVEHREFSPLKWFVIGLLTSLLSVTVSPHLEVLLLPLGLYYVYYFGAWRRWSTILAGGAGVIIGLLGIVGLFSLFNPAVTIIGDTTHGSEFYAVIDNLPIRHMFSFSAQFRQLGAKGFYLWNEAPVFGFLLPFSIISEIFLHSRGRINRLRSFLTVSLLAVLFSSLFLQSTLPYYLIHVLPLISLVFMVQLDAWRLEARVWKALPATAIAACIGIMATTGLGLQNARELGKRVTVNNAAAVQAAMEHASHSWLPGTPKPLVLAQGPAIHELLRDTSYRIMSEAFLFFPERSESVDTLLRRLGVDYVLDYHHPMTAEYGRTVLNRGTPAFARIGKFLDRSCDYFEGVSTSIDTLTLYHVHND